MRSTKLTISLSVGSYFLQSEKYALRIWQFPFWQEIARNDPQVFYRTEETLVITRINPN